MKIKGLRVIALVLLILLVGGSIVSAKSNPFRVQVRASYPMEVRTVHQAADHLLETIGYRLLLIPPAPAEAREIARIGVGPLARSGEIIPLEDALLLLVGEQNRVVVDHEHQLVTFEKIPGGSK